MSSWTCSEPYNTVYLEQQETGLHIAPCCVATPELYDTNATLFDQPYLQQIRAEFDNNKIPSACAYCVKNEQNGLTSRRQSSGQDEHVHQLKNLEIHVGNYCNLKCVICSNKWSSAWRTDAAALGYKIFNNFKFNPDELVKDLDTDTVDWLHFNGGEPLFTDIHRDVLNSISNPEKCTVYYNTNGTIRVTDSVFELWSKFKLVKLIFSIDDVGERFNYQRTNADWSQVESNMFWYRDVAPSNMMFGINRTISKLNIDHLSDLDEWFVNFFPTNKEGDQNDYTNQTATGPCAVNANETQFKTYIDNLNKLRTY